MVKIYVRRSRVIALNPNPYIYIYIYIFMVPYGHMLYLFFVHFLINFLFSLVKYLYSFSLTATHPLMDGAIIGLGGNGPPPPPPPKFFSKKYYYINGINFSNFVQ